MPIKSTKLSINSLTDFKEISKKFPFTSFWSNFRQSYISLCRPDLERTKPFFEINIKDPSMSLENLGELYEISLEINNKLSKKEMGKYFSPKDVAQFMAYRLLEKFNIRTDTLADVGCGTGNLIIEVLSLLRKREVANLIRDKKIFIYDIDKEALEITLMKIAILFIEKDDIYTYKHLKESVNVNIGNFLDSTINLPSNSMVIANPPYGKIPPQISVEDDLQTKNTTNEQYAVFLEKIALQCKGAVVITPQSFLGGEKFTSLREVLSSLGGSVFSFDNVPGTIFTGRKKGIFNTNTANSVRAAITIIDKKQKGFNISPMLRFNCNEREFLFKNADKLLGNIRYTDSKPWLKIPKTLETLASKMPLCPHKVKDFIEDLPMFQNKQYKINIPMTPRYFITGSHKDLQRSSCIEIFAKDKASFYMLYAMINSSFSYLWWRMYDGGITLKKSTLLDLPIPSISISTVKDVVEEGVKNENKFVVNKLNSGKNNENIKFPDSYRRHLNSIILNELGLSPMKDTLFSVHSNSIKKVFQLWN